MSFYFRHFFSPINLIYILFMSLLRNSLRPLSGSFYPLSGLSSEGFSSVFRGRLSALVFSKKLLGSHRGHLRLQTSLWPQAEQQWTPELERSGHPEIPLWPQPFQQRSVLFSMSSGSLLKQRSGANSMEVPGNGTMHAQNFLGQSPLYQTHCISSLVFARNGNVYIVLRQVCVLLDNGSQVNVRLLCERQRVSIGISNHQKAQDPESLEVWL